MISFSDIGYGNYILTSPAEERKGRSKTDNATVVNDDIHETRIYKNRKKDSKQMNKNIHSRLISLSAQKQKEVESSGQNNILYNLSSHLRLPLHTTVYREEDNKSIGKDADKINATELLSDINTLTNPFNQKRRIDL